ncbi:MAG: twin-arginine translocase TatA/TatE family subunit [Polyangiaceae bacterium]|nr:twin-arginine translocase TatA/TatE family subunit [Polyangiaceae bacterium]MCW5790799.1 twin-arginine translocase TatA/TatE family subunit [Polyangiaceae bacterium]
MGAMSMGHWLIVALVVLLVFGPKRLGQVGSGLGEGIRNFKRGLSEPEARSDASEPSEEPKKLPKRDA